MTRRLIARAAILAAVAALVLSAGACARRQQAAAAVPPASVQTARAVSADTPVTVQAFGSTKDRASVDIVAQVSGLLMKTLIHDGAVVTNGQPLFLIDPRDYDARVRQTEAALDADRVNLDLARLKVERTEPLLAKKLVSPDDFDTIKARAAALKAQIEADEAALDTARLNLERCTVAAPLAGICSKRGVDDGNLVSAGATWLTNIRSYDPMIVEFSVSEQYLPLIRRAMADGEARIEVGTPGDTNRVTGTVPFVDNAVNPLTGTVLLRGEVPNPDLKLWARQFVEVRMTAGVIRGAVMVPESAAQFGKEGPYLYVVTAKGSGAATHSVAELRLVKTGVRYEGRIQIVEGVATGKDVVTLGQLMLRPGAPVMDVGRIPAGGAGMPGGA